MKTSALRSCALIALFVVACAQAATGQTQNASVRGHVYDQDGKKLHHAMVSLKENPQFSRANFFASTVSDEEGRFTISSQKDSVLLEASLLGYTAVTKIVPRDCEIDIQMIEEPQWRDLYVGPPAIIRPLRTGYVLDTQGRPIAGAVVSSKGEDEMRDSEVQTKDDGSFEIRSGNSAVLTITAEGHKPIRFDMAKLVKDRKPSALIKHDGLSIFIDFNW